MGQLFTENCSRKGIYFKVCRGIQDYDIRKRLVEIYTTACQYTDLMSPTIQNFNQDHLEILLDSEDCLKIIMCLKENNQIIGFTLTTNNLDLCPWINQKYFKHHFADLFQQKRIWYNIGVSVDLSYQDKGLTKYLLIENHRIALEKEGVLWVDISQNVVGGNAEAWLNYFSDWASKQLQKEVTFVIYDKQCYIRIWFKEGNKE